jgi:hypothetical protein
MRKTSLKLGLLMSLMATLCAAQQGSVQKEGNHWTGVANGSLQAAHNLRIKVEAGTVRVEGGSSQGISYVIHSKSYEGSEDRARRQLESYKISAYVRGDTAWIVGEWEGGSPHKFSSEVNVTVPRNMEFVKIETEGGDVVTTGISGRLEAQSGGGTVHLDDIGGTVNAETGGGAIDVGNVGSDLSLRTGGQFCDQVAHPELTPESEETHVSLKLDLGNVAIVDFPDRCITDLCEVGLVPVPGEGNTDEGRDEDHQDLVVFAHYGNHGVSGLRWRNLGSRSGAATGF